VKRKLAIAFLAFLGLLLVGTWAVLRTPWAGNKICDLAEAKVAAAAGLELSLGSCRIYPLRLEVLAEQVRLGPAGAPIFTADSVRARLAPLQALGRRIHVADLAVVRPRLALAIPAPAKDRPAAACPPPLLEQFDLHHLEVQQGVVDLTLPGGERIAVSRIDVSSGPSSVRRTLRSLAVRGGRRSHFYVDVGPTEVEAGGRTTHFDRARLDADLALDLSALSIQDLTVQGEGVQVRASGEVANLCRPRLDLKVAAQAPLPAIFALAGKAKVKSGGSAAVEVKLAGEPSSPSVSGELRLSAARIEQYVPGDARAVFRLSGRELKVERLDIPFATGGLATVKATLTLGKEVGLVADLETRQLEFAELLSRLGLEGAHVMMRLGARARVQGTAYPLRLVGDAAVDVQDFRVLYHRWERARPGDETALDFPKAHLDTAVRVVPDGVELEGGQVKMGAETLAVAGKLFFDDAAGFRVSVDGAADLSALRHIAEVKVGGRAELAGTVRASPYGDPRIETRVRASAFRFLDLDLEQLAAAVSYGDGVLRVEDGHGSKRETRYAVDATVNLGKTPVQLTSGRATARGRFRDLFDMVMPWLPGTRVVRDALDGDVSVEMRASGNLPRLDADFGLQVGRGELFRRPFESGEARGRIVRGERVIFEEAQVRRGISTLRGSGTIAFDPPAPWDLQLAFSGAALGELGLEGGPWGGVASGQVAVGGSMEDPTLRFDLAADDVTVMEVPVGAVQGSGLLEKRRLTLNGSTAGVQFSSTIRLEGEMPFEARADVDVEDVTRFIPGGPPAGLQAQVKGEATAQGVLARLAEARARVVLSRLRGGYGDFRVDNQQPVIVSADRGRVEVESFTLVGQNTQFALSGVRAPDGTLALSAGGSLDLRLLGGLVPGVTRTRGKLTLDAQVAGTGREPLLVGSGQIRDGGFRLKELPIEFAAMNGDLSFSQNLVVFEGLTATLNGGKATLRGEMQLARFVPARIQVEANVENVPTSIPSYIPARVSGQLRAFGTPEAMTLAGTLHVLRAAYTEKFDLEKRLLEFGRRKPEVRPYDKSGEWLRFDLRMIVDGDARIDNDLVRGNGRGEITLTGDLAGFGLVGSLQLLPGSRASFRGNEFVISRAVVTFTERRRVVGNLDVTGEATVRDYRVAIHVTGTLDDPQLQMTSKPTLSQQDIITLLSLGYTSRDTTVGTGVGGAATAAAAQALFAASGLNDQLKRFLPPGGAFQDFSVRVGSAYSPSSMQVEPKMEFETKAAEGKLRLRYQAPLAGGSRGQKAQVEYRTGQRSSIQAQWDNDTPDAVTGSDIGVDFKLRWEWRD
jgi:translocation and assembly module TamB